jgi:hypothetical protein
VSIELGHLYMEDFATGPARLAENFRAVSPWVRAVAETTASELAARVRPRLSTCFLIDDYFTRFSSPSVVVPQLIAAAAQHGLTIDYLAREAGCAATADGRELAGLLWSRIVPPPPEGANGSGRDALDSGWLANGARSPSRGGEAMAPDTAWVPPSEVDAHRHSIFLDAQLWDGGPSGERRWSCPFLAAVWQCLRLGLLRDGGEPVATPEPWDGGDFPGAWDELPALLRLNPEAAPFTAYRTFSVLGSRFLPIEHTVRLVLGNVAFDAAVLGQAVTRAAGERVGLGRSAADRVAYAFLPPTQPDPAP